ncbi:hypothetical protein [Photobacterium carnosum]|uniref:hypothetical protein n=1 Tax=Photobacterium carnosum TaxID=2023717 RepID=UPI001E46EDDF|nr:hypothetical protein [Photobacterium carnosum]MCD9516619.1 hypothetical protein [Photobacterium carnosum]
MQNKIDVLFDNTVKLFKSFEDNISCENGFLRLKKEVILSEEQAMLLRYLFDKKDKFRKFEISIDWDDAIDSSSIAKNEHCTELKVEFYLYRGNKFSFYDNEKDLFQKLSSFLIKGKSLPDNYYLIDDDFRSDSELVHPSIMKLPLISEWIDFLTKISDIDKETEDGITLYYFIKGKDDKYAKPLEVKINSILELINIDEISSIEDISKLVSEDDSGNLHHRDRQSFFKLALVDTLRKLVKDDLSKKTEAIILFTYLGAIKNTYYEHYDIFIHNFAIGEFQQQVEEKGFDYAEKISSVLNDIQIRLYAIPVVLVSLGALAKVDNIYSYLFIISGVIITALFNYWMINDQILRLEQIEKSSLFTFSKLKIQGHEKLESCDTLKNLDEIFDNIQSRITDRNTKIKYYQIFCWLPTIITLILLLVKESSNICGFFDINVGNATTDDFICIITGVVRILHSFV